MSPPAVVEAKAPSVLSSLGTTGFPIGRGVRAPAMGKAVEEVSWGRVT